MLIIVFVKLHCPRCGRLIPAAGIDLPTLQAKCGFCDLAFSFSINRQQDRAFRPSFADQTSTIALRPPGMFVDDVPGFFRIRWRWFSYETVWATLFCVAFDAALIHWYRMPGRVHASLITPNNIILILFLIPCVIMTYSVLCGYFNITKIILNRSELVVTRGPLPCGGNRRLSVNQIQQLDSERSFVPASLLQGGERRNFFVSGKFEKSRGWMSSLNARMTDGSVVQLIGLRTPNVAEFLQFTLEQRLTTLHKASPANSTIEG